MVFFYDKRNLCSGTQTNLLDPILKPNAIVICRPFLVLIIVSDPNYHANLSTASKRFQCIACSLTNWIWGVLCIALCLKLSTVLEVFIFKACLWYSHRMAQFTALPEQLLMRPVVVVDVYIATFMLKMALGEITSVAALKIICASSFSYKSVYHFCLGFYCILL